MDIHIFHLTPWGLKYAQRWGHNGPGKIMAPCGQRQKVSDMPYLLACPCLNLRMLNLKTAKCTHMHCINFSGAKLTLLLYLKKSNISSQGLHSSQTFGGIDRAASHTEIVAR